MTQSEWYDMIVVGAGISGLSLAHQLATAGKKVLVLEADSRIGGCLHTHYHDKNDFWVEMGAHTFYASYTNLIDLLQKTGLDSDIKARQKTSMKVFTGQHEKIMSHVNKWELFCSLPNLFFSKREGKTAKQYFERIVGRKNYNNVFSRMFSAVIVQNADEFSAEFFLKRRKTKSKEHPKSFVLKKGMQSFMDGLGAAENITLRTNQKLISIQKAEMFELTSESGEKFEGKDIALAVSPAVAAKLIAGISPVLSQKLKEYPIQNIISRGLVLPKENLNLDPVSFVIPLQGPCFAMVTRDVMPHEESRGFAFHFKEGELSKEEQEAFMAELLGIPKSELGETVQAKHCLPLLQLGHKERIAEIKTLAEQCGIYLTGNYFNGLSLEDCVERSKIEFERYRKDKA